MACGINPQGYHGVNFGSFHPKCPFRVRQQLAAERREVTADREGLHGSRRFPTCSLPEIKVKRLFNKTKRKKHLRSHTFDSASGERLRLPAILPQTIESKRGRTEDLSHHSDKRIVKNSRPWWKWNQEGRSPHCQQHPKVDADGDVCVRASPMAAAKHVQRNLRATLPPLMGYRDDNGNLVFSELGDINNLGPNNYYCDVQRSHRFLNRRYYYSQSRDGIRPILPGAKVTLKQACLYDLGESQQHDPRFTSHQNAMLSSMYADLQAIPGLPSNDGFLGAHLSTLNSRMGAKLKQSLNSVRDKQCQMKRSQEVVFSDEESVNTFNPKEKNIQPVVTINIDPDEESDAQVQAMTVPHFKAMNPNNLKALAILNELIDVLNSTQYAQCGTDSKCKASLTSQVQPILSRIDLADFFQVPESTVRQYDRCKMIYNSVHSNHHGSEKSDETKEPGKVRDQDGLAQLLAIQQLQSSFNSLTANHESIVQGFNSENEVYPFQTKHQTFANSSSVEHELACIDLNDQYFQFSNGKLKTKTVSRTPTNHKLVRNLSKLLAVELVRRQGNPRPDLEISGEQLKHLYELGLFEQDQELKEIAKEASGRITLSREQFTKVQDICNDIATTNEPPTFHLDVASESYLNATMDHVNSSGNLQEDREIVDDGESYNYRGVDHGSNVLSKSDEMQCLMSSTLGPSYGVTASEVLDIHVESEDGEGNDVQSNALHEGQNALNQDTQLIRKESWDLEREFTKMKAMDLQQRLHMKQVKKEQKILESVRRDLKYYQETLHDGGKVEKKQHKLRESLLPPPLPSRKKSKTSQLRIPKRNEDQLPDIDDCQSNDQSSDEVEITGPMVADSETVSDEGVESEAQMQEPDDQLLSQDDATSNLADDSEEDSGDSELEDDLYVGTSHNIGMEAEEEEFDGRLHDSVLEQMQTEIQHSSHISLSGSRVELSSSLEADGDSDNHCTTLSGSSKSTPCGQGRSADAPSRMSTALLRKTVSKIINTDPLGQMDVGSTSASTSMGMRGSSLPRSRRGKRSESNAELEISRPQTVKQIDLELRGQSRQGSRLPTREKSRNQFPVADPTQLLIHRKSQLAKQKLVEEQKIAAVLEQEREIQKQQKRLRQAEIEEKMNLVLEGEEIELRRQRKLKAEARKRAEELEAQRQLLLKQMAEQEALREAQEKARHSAMLESLRQEANKRQQLVLHEKAVVEEYQQTIDVWNNWEYAYIDYYMGDEFSQLARKADQARELEAKQLLQKRIMEAFEFKRRELLEKLKAVQKQLKMDLTIEKGQLDHFLRISRAFVFSYFERVPNQTYMVPEDMLL